MWAFLIRRGRRRRRDAPEWLKTYHYERVAWENGITREKVEDSFYLDWDADWAILDDAVNLFNDVAPRRMPRRPQSWDGRRVRLMEDEWEKAVAKLATRPVEFAHAVGVVHRDIKPENLLLDTARLIWRRRALPGRLTIARARDRARPWRGATRA